MMVKLWNWCKEYYQAAWTFGITLGSLILTPLFFWMGFETLGYLALVTFYVVGGLAAMMLITWGCFALQERKGSN